MIRFAKVFEIDDDQYLAMKDNYEGTPVVKFIFIEGESKDKSYWMMQEIVQFHDTNSRNIFFDEINDELLLQSRADALQFKIENPEKGNGNVPERIGQITKKWRPRET